MIFVFREIGQKIISEVRQSVEVGLVPGDWAILALAAWSAGGVDWRGIN